MAKRIHPGVLVVASVWVSLGAAVGYAQTAPPADNPAPCTVAPQPEPCGTKPAPGTKPSAAERFPFPGEPGAPAANAPAPDLSGAPDAPAKPDASANPDASAKPDAAKQFPFPGEPSAKPDAAKEFPFPGEPAAKPDAGASSSSSSSGDDSTPVDPGASPGESGDLKDKGSEGASATPGRHLLHRVNPIGTKLQSPDEREAEDLDIAHYYTQTGDLQGAYLRSQDAVKTKPDDADAHFALAEAALKLNKKDEAIAEYNACLKLDASDKELKEAHKALARLKP